MEKRHESGTGIEAVLVRSPRLKRTAGHVKHLDCLTLGHILDFQIAIPRKQVSVFDAILALVTFLIATVLVLDDGAHSYLPLLKPLS